MDFSSKIKNIIKTLDCTNAQLARICGIDPSLVSRFRTGARQPRPNSEQFLRFCRGVAVYAQENEMWDKLRTACQLTAKGSPEDEIRKYLTGDDTVGIVRDSGVKTVYESVNMFGTRLNSVMNILDISNIRLARALNVDTSLISRFRNGLRIPPKDGPLIDNLCGYLYKVVKVNAPGCHLNTIIGLTGVHSDMDEVEFISCMNSWLSDYNEIQNTGVMDSFLERLDSLSTVKNPDGLLMYSIQPFEEASDCIKDYIGTDGIRQAVIRFLSAAASSQDSQIMKLYSDQNMSWLTSDPSFTKKWELLMCMALKNKNRIKIIHNIDRSLLEMLMGIEKWLPLYTTGMVEGYYCKAPSSDRFSHTLFVSPQTAAVCAWMVAGTEDFAEYFYTDKQDKVEYLDTQFNALLETSKPLIQVYKNSNANDYQILLSEMSFSHGDVKRLMLSPPISAMPAQLLEKMLIRSEMEMGEIKRILSAHDLLSKQFENDLKNGRITDYIVFPDDEALLSSDIILNLPEIFSDWVVAYQAEEYIEHIRAIIPLLDMDNYNIVPLPESPFANIQMTVKEGVGAIVQKTDLPVTAFRFSHPLMCRALSQYIDAIGQQSKSKSSDKKELRSYLHNRYLSNK